MSDHVVAKLTHLRLIQFCQIQSVRCSYVQAERGTILRSNCWLDTRRCALVKSFFGDCCLGSPEFSLAFTPHCFFLLTVLLTCRQLKRWSEKQSIHSFHRELD